MWLSLIFHKANHGTQGRVWDFLSFVGLSEEEALALQNKLDAFYTIMNQEMEVLKEQSNKIKRERDVRTSKSILFSYLFLVQ